MEAIDLNARRSMTRQSSISKYSTRCFASKAPSSAHMRVSLTSWSNSRSIFWLQQSQSCSPPRSLTSIILGTRDPRSPCRLWWRVVIPRLLDPRLWKSRNNILKTSVKRSIRNSVRIISTRKLKISRILSLMLPMARPSLSSSSSTTLDKWEPLDRWMILLQLHETAMLAISTGTQTTESRPPPLLCAKLEAILLAVNLTLI